MQQGGRKETTALCLHSSYTRRNPHRLQKRPTRRKHRTRRARDLHKSRHSTRIFHSRALTSLLPLSAFPQSSPLPPRRAIPSILRRLTLHCTRRLLSIHTTGQRATLTSRSLPRFNTPSIRRQMGHLFQSRLHRRADTVFPRSWIEPNPPGKEKERRGSHDGAVG
ncbi:hypothetical protein DFH08DRAFT_857045 [Mycena albidolilacea]|uniref:Uncharacterized protein n=1 Tax=Mycena albidolilacea TaxID=1033008 RepID=A0AAD7ABP1_9AGAR|nr:hypothetical protein DFH08DRAFT_857045 [Mycena albidolilacea]